MNDNQKTKSELIVRAMDRDVTERIQAEREVRETVKKLRKAMDGIIQSMALTVETRDPYTAGHQRRVADLAQSIAREMGLSEDQGDGLRMAGVVHDLGKIAVPAEILYDLLFVMATRQFYFGIISCRRINITFRTIVKKTMQNFHEPVLGLFSRII